MARKEKIVTVAEEGRDKGRNYFIKEFPASHAEKLAVRTYLALGAAGIEVPQELVNAGLAGLAMIGLGLFSGAKFSDIEPIMDEMMTCVQFVDALHPEIRRPLIEDDIEEVKTRFLLRAEVFTLHTGFSVPGFT